MFDLQNSGSNSKCLLIRGGYIRYHPDWNTLEREKEMQLIIMPVQKV